eukprot:GGOE01032548.1.p3 GENE.GGOE01032548.1~~GGOE01032548.1.p3  ORF type:complete len:117 (-),score=7.27 GGOE01032548.1:755-1105(-)
MSPSGTQFKGVWGPISKDEKVGSAWHFPLSSTQLSWGPGDEQAFGETSVQEAGAVLVSFWWLYILGNTTKKQHSNKVYIFVSMYLNECGVWVHAHMRMHPAHKRTAMADCVRGATR